MAVGCSVLVRFPDYFFSSYFTIFLSVSTFIPSFYFFSSTFSPLFIPHIFPSIHLLRIIDVPIVHVCVISLSGHHYICLCNCLSVCLALSVSLAFCFSIVFLSNYYLYCLSTRRFIHLSPCLNLHFPFSVLTFFSIFHSFFFFVPCHCIFSYSVTVRNYNTKALCFEVCGAFTICEYCSLLGTSVYFTRL